MKKHLVMLHGFGCDSRVFASIGHKLSKDYDVLMVDLPGHGQTKEQFRDFSFSAYTIASALDIYLEGDPYSLLGWSMGGQIALEMFNQKKNNKCTDKACKHEHHEHAEHESAIENLILISTTPKFVESDDFKIGMNKAVFNKFKKGIEGKPEKAMEGFYPLMFSEKEDASKFIPSLKEQLPPHKTLFHSILSFERFDEQPVLQSINIPTLIMAGTKDGVIDPKASLYLSQEIKGSILKMFDGAGHAPHLTLEAEVFDELTRFLG